MRGRAQRSRTHDWAVSAAPTLLRLAHQLTGDPDAARAAVAQALARVPPRQATSDDGALDELVTRELIRSLPRRSSESVTPSSLDRLTPRSRVAATLAFGPGWDAEGIADATGMSPGRVRAAVSAALAVAAQDVWERLLSDPRWSLPTPPMLVADVERNVQQRHSDNRLRALGAAGVALALLAVVVVVVRTATAPEPLPPTPHEAGLLHWAPRGDLVRDRGLIDDAAALWRRGPLAPANDRKIYVLWAGRVGVGRLVVLQAIGVHGTRQVAVVADHDVSYRHTVLRVDVVGDVPDADPATLVIPYDGNLNVAGLQSGPSQQVIQLLVRPGVDRVEQRSTTSASIPPVVRPSFKDQPLTDGLSAPWLVIVGDQPSSAVRVWAHGQVLFTGVLGSLDQLVAGTAVPSVAAPPPAWSGLPRELPAAALADDALWWAQVCHRLDPAVSLVWVSPQPPAARLEFVDCAPGERTSARLLVDRPGGTTWADTQILGRQAAIVEGLAAPIVGAQHVGGGLVVVVGDVRVAGLEVSGRRLSGRWGVFSATGVTEVRAFDAHGRPLPL